MFQSQSLGSLLFCLLFCQYTWALQIFHFGNPQDQVVPVSPRYCLAGGGSDDVWSEGWKYWLQSAAGGDVVVIRAGGAAGGYGPWIINDEGHHGFPQMNSVTVLSFENPGEASSPEVVKILEKAELVFFSGGDQSLYLDWLHDSELQRLLEKAIREGRLSVGGTSAGMAILGGIDYSGRFDSPAGPNLLVSAIDVLQNPLGDFVDLDTNFLSLPFLEKVVTDTHFSQLYRQGRLMGFMARAAWERKQNVSALSIKALAADEDTGFCYDNTGVGKVFGEGQVFFLKGNSPLSPLKINQLLDWQGKSGAVIGKAIDAKSSLNGFDVRKWQSEGGQRQSWSVEGQSGSEPIFKINGKKQPLKRVEPRWQDAGL